MKRFLLFNEEKMMTGGLVVLLFLLPLVFQPFLSDPFGLPKVTLLRIMSLFLFALCLTRIVRGEKISWQKTPLNLAVVLFLFVCGLSTLFSVSPRLSFWGMHGFYFEGFLSFLCYGIIYFVTANFITDREKVLKSLVITSIFVSLYALVQAAGITFFVWRGTQPYPRVWSTFGNPNFLASYLVMVIPFNLVFMVKSTGTKEKALYGFLAFLSLLALIFTYSRAAWLSMAVGFTVFALMINRRQPKTNLILLMGIIISSIILASLYPRFYPRNRERTSLFKPILSRAVSTVDFSEPGIAGRLSAWRTAVKMVLKRPVLGFGLDTLGMSFRQFMSKEYEEIAGRFRTAGYAHNEFLQYGATIGLVGLVAYLFLLFTLFRVLLNLARQDETPLTPTLSPLGRGRSNALTSTLSALGRGRKSEGKNKNLLASGLCASCVALLVNNQFGFSTIVPATLLWFSFGLVANLSEGEKREFSLPIPRAAKYLISGMLLLAAVLFSFYVFQFLIASRFDRLAQDSQEEGKWEQAMALEEKSVKYDPFQGLYHMHLAKIYQQMVGNAKTLEEKEMFFRKSLDEYRREIAAYPYHALAYNGMGVTYIYANAFLHKDTLEEAIACFEKAVKFDTYFVEAYSNLAAVIYQRGEVEKAIGLYLRIIELRPKVSISYYNLGNLYAREGEYSKAVEYWQKTLKIDPNFEEAEERLLQLWQEMEKGGE